MLNVKEWVGNPVQLGRSTIAYKINILFNSSTLNGKCLLFSGNDTVIPELLATGEPRTLFSKHLLICQTKETFE